MSIKNNYTCNIPKGQVDTRERQYIHEKVILSFITRSTFPLILSFFLYEDNLEEDIGLHTDMLKVSLGQRGVY